MQPIKSKTSMAAQDNNLDHLQEENDTSQEVTAQEQTRPVGREALLARVREHYPERDFEQDDDDSLYGGLDEYARERDEELGRYKESEKALSEMFTRDPRSANLLLDLRDGKSLAVELVRRFGPELKEELDNPELLDQIAEAERDYIERVQQGKQFEEEYKTNLPESLKLLTRWKEEHGYSDSDEQEVMNFLQEVTRNVILGIFTSEMLDVAYNALHYQGDIKDAESLGEARGRNARIVEQTRKASETDNIPVLGGASNSIKPRGNRNPLFVLAEQTKQNNVFNNNN